MQQTTITALLVALMATAAGADDLIQKLRDEREFRKGEKYLKNYFKAQAELVDSDGRRGARWQKRSDEAAREFMLWLQDTQQSLGVDLRTRPDIVLTMIDEARLDYLNKRGFRKGKISFFREEEPQGMSRLEYALLVPDVYDISRFEVRVPVIVALHGRATDPKHPAFRSADANERGRQVIYNYWRKTPAADKAMILAPTGKPGGFRFHGRNIYEDRQVLFRSLIEVMKNYRVDGDRLYLDAQGAAVRVMCRQTFFFAGFVLRDHIMDRRDPLLPSEEQFLLHNLNGKPLVYIADERYWEQVGAPTWKALQAAYKGRNVANLKLIKAKRDPGTGALQADAGAVWTFLSGRKRAEPTEFEWRFPNENYMSAGPVELMRPNFNLDVDAEMSKVSLEKKCGRLKYKKTVVEAAKLKNGEPVKNKDGSPVKISVNRIEISITECEKIALNLHDGIVDFNLPVTIVVNGQTLVEQNLLERDWEFFWQNVLPARFFMTPYVHRLELSFEGKPEWNPPAEKGEGGEKDAGGGAEDPAKTDDAAKADAAAAGK